MSRLPISNDFEALAAATLAERGPVPIKASKGRARVLKVVDKDGKVTGYTTHGKVLEAVAIVAEIEIAVQDGERPDLVLCIDCKAPRKVHKNAGKIPKWCTECLRKKDREDCARRREANREQSREKARARYWANVEKQRERARKYQEAHGVEQKKKAKDRREADPVKNLERKRIDYHAHVEKRRAANNARYARRKGAQSSTETSAS